MKINNEIERNIAVMNHNHPPWYRLEKGTQRTINTKADRINKNPKIRTLVLRNDSYGIASEPKEDSESSSVITVAGNASLNLKQ